MPNDENKVEDKVIFMFQSMHIYKSSVMHHYLKKWKKIYGTTSASSLIILFKSKQTKKKYFWESLIL